MSESWKLGAGQAHELELALKRDGLGPEFITRLTQDQSLRKAAAALMGGRVEIRYVHEVWRRIQVVGMTKREYAAACWHVTGAVNPSAAKLFNLPEFEMSSESYEIDLAVVTPADLGFQNGVDYFRMLSCARERGLDLCPHDVALAVFLSGKGIDYGSRLSFAMTPLRFDPHDPAGHILQIGMDDEELAFWLDASPMDSRCDIPPNHRFVFKLLPEARKKEKKI